MMYELWVRVTFCEAWRYVGDMDSSGRAASRGIAWVERYDAVAWRVVVADTSKVVAQGS